MKDYLLTQQEYDEFCNEYETWCDQQETIWGYEPAECQMDLETQQGYRISGILALDPIPVKI